MGKHSEFDELKREIMIGIYRNRMLLTAERDRPEGWKLVSGKWSPFYIQLRVISSFPQILAKVGRVMAEMIKEEAPHINKLVGIAFAGIPIATAVSLESGLPSVHTRKITGVKSDEDFQKYLIEYGQHSLVEGILEDGDALCLVDDLVTGLTSKMTAKAQVIAELTSRDVHDVTCDDIAVLVDRQQGAEEAARKANMHLHSVIKFVDEGLPLLKDIMSEKEHKIVSEYLANPESYQKE
ncbi:MAG: orotate phosphoribosyltransferase [Candidatus Thorarchaeota archaeon]